MSTQKSPEEGSVDGDPSLLRDQLRLLVGFLHDLLGLKKAGTLQCSHSLLEFCKSIKILLECPHNHSNLYTLKSRGDGLKSLLKFLPHTITSVENTTLIERFDFGLNIVHLTRKLTASVLLLHRLLQRDCFTSVPQMKEKIHKCEREFLGAGDHVLFGPNKAENEVYRSMKGLVETIDHIIDLCDNRVSFPHVENYKNQLDSTIQKMVTDVAALVSLFNLFGLAFEQDISPQLMDNYIEPDPKIIHQQMAILQKVLLEENSPITRKFRALSIVEAVSPRNPEVRVSNIPHATTPPSLPKFVKPMTIIRLTSLPNSPEESPRGVRYERRRSQMADDDDANLGELSFRPSTEELIPRERLNFSVPGRTERARYALYSSSDSPEPRSRAGSADKASESSERQHISTSDSFEGTHVRGQPQIHISGSISASDPPSLTSSAETPLPQSQDVDDPHKHSDDPLAALPPFTKPRRSNNSKTPRLQPTARASSSPELKNHLSESPIQPTQKKNSSEKIFEILLAQLPGFAALWEIQTQSVKNTIKLSFDGIPTVISDIPTMRTEAALPTALARTRTKKPKKFDDLRKSNSDERRLDDGESPTKLRSRDQTPSRKERRKQKEALASLSLALTDFSSTENLQETVMFTKNIHHFSQTGIKEDQLKDSIIPSINKAFHDFHHEIKLFIGSLDQITKKSDPTKSIYQALEIICTVLEKTLYKMNISRLRGDFCERVFSQLRSKHNGDIEPIDSTILCSDGLKSSVIQDFLYFVDQMLYSLTVNSQILVFDILQICSRVMVQSFVEHLLGLLSSIFSILNRISTVIETLCFLSAHTVPLVNQDPCGSPATSIWKLIPNDVPMGPELSFDEAIVCLLPSQGVLNKEFVCAFTANYRQIGSPQLFLSKIFDRFCVPVDCSQNELVLKLRIISVLQKWIAENVETMSDNDKKSVQDFCDKHSGDSVLGPKLKKILPELNHKNQVAIPCSPSQFDFPDKCDFHSFCCFILHRETKEIAEQLTLIEYQYFSALRYREFIGGNWNRPKTRALSQHLCALIRRSTCVSVWTSLSILFSLPKKEQASLITKFIEISQILISFHNWATAVSILSGLTSASIKRLTEAWSFVSEETTTSFKSLSSLISPEQNYAKLRKSQETLTHGIPFIGMYLTDLSMLDVAPDIIDSKINIQKTVAVHRIIQQKILCEERDQTVIAKIPKSEPLYSLLSELGVSPEDDEALYEFSLLRQPRTSVKQFTFT